MSPIKTGQKPEAASCTECPLRRDGFFCDLPDEVFDEWARRSTAIRVKARAKLYRRDERLEDILMLCQGQAGLVYGRSRETFVGAVQSPGKLLGVREFVLGTRFQDAAVAYSDLLVRKLPVADFAWLFSNSQEFATRVIASLAAELSTTHELLWVCRADTVQKRLARILLHLSRSANGSSDQPVILSRRQIAEIIRSSRETVTRRLAELRALGVVETEAGEIRIVDPPTLQRMAR